LPNKLLIETITDQMNIILLLCSSSVLALGTSLLADRRKKKK